MCAAAEILGSKHEPTAHTTASLVMLRIFAAFKGGVALSWPSGAVCAGLERSVKTGFASTCC